MGADLRLAVAQAPGALTGTEARLDWLARVLPDVAADGADLLVLPELFACGYHVGDQLVPRAEPAEGPIAQTVASLARSHRVGILYGYAERAGPQIFNSALCVGPDGQRLGHHRKLAIPPGWEQDLFAAGQGVRVFDCLGIRCAILICYDAEFAETVRHAAALGAELVLVPTALGAQWGWVADTMIPTRAYENGIYLAYANSAGTENGLSYLGRSVIAAPNGCEAARAGADPQIIMADLDRDTVRAAQTRLPYLKDRSALTLQTPQA